MAKKCWLALILAAFAAGGLFAREAFGCEYVMFAEFDAALAPNERIIAFSNANIGGGIVFDGSRSRNTDYGRFWSQIYTGPWGFVDAGALEFSVGFVLGRVARQNRWCFPILAMNVSMLWRTPFDFVGIAPLLGFSLDTIVWARHRCLRSDYTLDTLPGHPIREFSSLKFMMGFGRDFNVSEDQFFRTRLLGYYGRRLGGNPNPFGGTLRLGVGRRL